MRHRTRDVPKSEFKQYMRNCKRCGKIYQSIARHGKICEDCNKNNKKNG